MRAALAGRTAILLEGILLMVVSLVAMAEGLRLIIYREPNTLYDPLGPGYYALAVSICLLAVSVAYLVNRFRRPSQGTETAPVDKKTRVRLLSTIAACCIYIVLIGVLGYLPATVVFFFLQFKIEGLKSWLSIAILSLVLSGLYYLVFIQLCNLILPAGIVFR